MRFDLVTSLRVWELSVARSELNTLLPLYCSLSSKHRLFFFKGRARGTREGERRCPLLSSLARASSNFLFSPPKNTGACYAGYCIAPRRGIQDSLGCWIPCHVFRITCQWNLDSGFLQLHSGFHTKNLLHSGFNKKEFPGFRDPDSLTWGDL